LDHPATGEAYGNVAYRWIEDTGITDLEGLHREQVLKWRKASLGHARQCGEWKAAPDLVLGHPSGGLAPDRAAALFDTASGTGFTRSSTSFPARFRQCRETSVHDRATPAIGQEPTWVFRRRETAFEPTTACPLAQEQLRAPSTDRSIPRTQP